MDNIKTEQDQSASSSTTSKKTLKTEKTLPASHWLQWANDVFKNDIYATKTTGIIIEEADINYAKCSLEINKNHLNAANHVMGGAIFTLADFTFAVAANINHPMTVSLNSTINFLNGIKGTKLIAVAKCNKSGRNTCFFDVNITDELGTNIATISTTGYRKNR